MRKPWPLREPITPAKPDVFSPAWLQSFTELYAYYGEVLRWADPGNPDFGKVEPPAAFRREGLIAYANGTNWNPGSGPGYYERVGAAWKKVTTQVYRSAEQTVTSAGGLTLAHGLVGVSDPALVEISCYLICKTAEHGYSIGDIFPTYHFAQSSSIDDNRGCVVVVDATNLIVRFGSNATLLDGLNKTTGNVVAFTLANWKAIFVARY